MPLRQPPYSFTRITTATTTQVKTGRGTLKRIVVNVPVSTGTITIYNNVSSGTDAPVGVITSTADLKPFSLEYDISMSTGIKIVTTQAQDITVVYA